MGQYTAMGNIRCRRGCFEQAAQCLSGELPYICTRQIGSTKTAAMASSLQKRMEELGVERFKTAGIKRDDKAARQTIFETNYRFFGAPAVIYLCMDRSLTPWSIFDIGMLAQRIMLAAQQYGLGSIPAYNLVSNPDIIRKELEIPDDLSIIIGIALGYSDTQHPQNKFRSPRRPIQEVVRFKGF